MQSHGVSEDVATAMFEYRRTWREWSDAASNGSSDADVAVLRRHAEGAWRTFAAACRLEGISPAVLLYRSGAPSIDWLHDESGRKTTAEKGEFDVDQGSEE